MIEQESQPILLDLGYPLLANKCFTNSSETANVLFKQIQNQMEAACQLRQKKNQNDVYDKIKQILQKKLGNTKFLRGVTIKQQIRIKQMMEICRQRKHFRPNNEYDRAMTTRSRVLSSRRRNFSQNEIKQRLTQKIQRSKSSGIESSRTTTNKFIVNKEKNAREKCSEGENRRKCYKKLKKQGTKCSVQVGDRVESCDQKLMSFQNSKQNNQSSGFEVENQNKENSQSIRYSKDKINVDYLKISSSLPSNSRISGPFHHNQNQQSSKVWARKKISKDGCKIKDQFSFILKGCQTAKQQIVHLDKKIRFFEIFCQRMALNKNSIQKFCKKGNEVSIHYDDEDDQ